MKETGLPTDSKAQLSNVTRSVCIMCYIRALPLSYLSTNRLAGTGICDITAQYILTGSSRPLDSILNLKWKMKMRLCKTDVQSDQCDWFTKYTGKKSVRNCE